MKRKIFKLSLLFCLIFFGCSEPIEKGVVFENVNIIPIWKDTVLENHNIKVVSGQIVSIDKKINIHPEDTIINGNGGYLLPGFWDMHTHLPNGEENGFGYERYLALNFLSGVTNIRNMRGFDSISSVVKKIKSKLILSPNVYFTPPSISRENHPPLDSLPFYVEKYQSEGFKYWKILSLPNKDYFDTLAKYAKRNQLKLAGHISNSVGLKKSIVNGYSCIEHLQGYNGLLSSDTLSFEDVLQRTKQHEVFNCATLDWYYIVYLQYPLEKLYRREHLKYIPKETVEGWKRSMADYLKRLELLSKDSLIRLNNSYRRYIENKGIVLKKLFDLECKLLISPDANGMFQTPGFSMLDEMKLYEKTGIPRYHILKMATQNAARWMEERTKGSIQEGMDADWVLYAKNPLLDLNNLKTITGIYFNRSWFDKEFIKENLKELE